MRYIDYILGILEEKCIDCSMETVDGIVIINAEKTPLALVPVTATDLASAQEQQENLRQLIGKLPQYPLIVTEDRWRRQERQITERILAHLGHFHQIYARNCEVRKIDKITAFNFLSENHSYGDASCRHRYGLFLKRYTGHQTKGNIEPGTLVAVGEFSNARRWNKEGKVICSYEWTRYASLPSVRVVGGMGKILKQFIADKDPDDIMSYADLEWSDGSVYQSLGFKEDGMKSPVCFAIDQLWNRTPLAKLQESTDIAGICPENDSVTHFFINLGSRKFRWTKQ